MSTRCDRFPPVPVYCMSPLKGGDIHTGYSLYGHTGFIQVHTGIQVVGEIWGLGTQLRRGAAASSSVSIKQVYTELTTCLVWNTLRIVNSMRYNALNGVLFPNKTARAGATNTYTNLTQPTEIAADWAGIDYTNPLLLRPGGIPSGRFCLAEPESRLVCPTQGEKTC